MKTKSFVLLVILAMAALHANAVLITFSDKADFLAATSATNATGVLPNLGFRGDTNTTVGVVAFQALLSNGLWVGHGPKDPLWTTLFGGKHAIAMNGDEGIDVSFPPTFSFGFDFVEPTNTSPEVFEESKFTVTLLNGTTNVGQFTFEVPNNVAAFVGVSSDIAFDGVQIRETVGGSEDEFYGEFYLGQQAAPVLNIHLLSIQEVRLSWSTNHINYVLESSVTLPTTTWETVTNNVAIAWEQFTVAVIADKTIHFFRLRKL